LKIIKKNVIKEKKGKMEVLKEITIVLYVIEKV